MSSKRTPRKAAKKKAKKSASKKAKAAPKKPRSALLAKHARFVEEYLIDLNGTQAAIRAGYTEANARSQACELLKRADVRQALSAAAKARADRTKVTADRVLEELKWVAFQRPEDYEITGDLEDPVKVKPGVPQEAMRAIAGVKVTMLSSTGQIKLVNVSTRYWNKMKAQELLMKHLGMLKDRIELDINAKVNFYIPDNGRGVR